APVPCNLSPRSAVPRCAAIGYLSSTDRHLPRKHKPMAAKRSPFSTLLVLAVLFAGVWLYFTPYLALNRLQKAARNGDSEAMAEMVDFPSLRESVKTNVRTQVERAVGRRSNPIGVLGGLLAGAVTSPLVDAFVTPQGIAALT